jgi:16S rRNA (guanine527-N7)-methyltransferase
MEDQRNARLATNDSAGSGSPGRTRDPSTGARAEPRKPLPTRVEGLAPLSPAYDASLEPGLAAIGVTLDPEQRAAIDAHVRLLLAWNEAINLTAITAPADVAIHHVVDSLTACAVLSSRGVDRLLDLGSGGGFPGLPLAVGARLRQAVLVESVGKKAAFLRAAADAVMARARGLDVVVAAERVEALASDPVHRGRWPAVTARAVGPLADLVELAFPLLQPGGCLVAWKRGDLTAELAAARRAMASLGGGTLHVDRVEVDGLDGHQLVTMILEGLVPAGFPRDPRIRRRRPW